jgi:hypothetical protein
LFLALGALASPLTRAASVVAPFPGDPDYIAQGTMVGAKTGPHRSTFTTRYQGEPAVASRPLSVHPQSTLNGDLSGNHAAKLGPKTLPPVYGGYTAVVYGMKEPAPFTTRAQFQDGPSGRNDFVNLNVYLESNQPQPAGLEFSFTGAFLFPAGGSGTPAIVPLETIANVMFFVASQRTPARLSRVLVRDADGGDYYVSDYHESENKVTIALAGAKWARINPADLTITGDYLPAAFQRVDHIGVYSTIPVTELAEPLPAFGVICNVAVHSFEYTVSR